MGATGRVRSALDVSAGTGTTAHTNNAATASQPPAPHVVSAMVIAAGANICTVAVVDWLTPWYTPRARSSINVTDSPQLAAT